MTKLIEPPSHRRQILHIHRMIHLKRAPPPRSDYKLAYLQIDSQLALTVGNDDGKLRSPPGQPRKSFFLGLFTSAYQLQVTGRIDTSDVTAVDALPIESAPQPEPPLPHRGKPKRSKYQNLDVVGAGVSQEPASGREQRRSACETGSVAGGDGAEGRGIVNEMEGGGEMGRGGD